MRPESQGLEMDYSDYCSGPRKKVKLPRIDCEFCARDLHTEPEVRTGPSGAVQYNSHRSSDDSYIEHFRKKHLVQHVRFEMGKDS